MREWACPTPVIRNVVAGHLAVITLVVVLVLAPKEAVTLATEAAEVE